jgi:hypothetical protein
MARRKLRAWTLVVFLLVVGFTLVVWADTLCEYLRGWMGGNWQLFKWSTLVIGVAVVVGFGPKVWKLARGQLGG